MDYTNGPVCYRDDAKEVARYEAYVPNDTREYFYHIKADDDWEYLEVPMTDHEAREVCRALVAQGAKSILALKALKQGVYTFNKGAEYIYPSTFAHHPELWIAPPQ